MATNDTTARPTETAPRAAAAESRLRAAAPRAAAPRAAPRARARSAQSAPERRERRARRAARRSTSTGTRRTTVGTTREPVAVTPIAQAQQLAERFVLIPIGVALEARDLVTDAVDSLVANSTDAIDGLRSATGSRRALGQAAEEIRAPRRQSPHRARARPAQNTHPPRARGAPLARARRETGEEARRGFDRQRTDARRVLDGHVGELQGRVARCASASSRSAIASRMWFKTASRRARAGWERSGAPREGRLSSQPSSSAGVWGGHQRQGFAGPPPADDAPSPPSTVRGANWRPGGCPGPDAPRI